MKKAAIVLFVLQAIAVIGAIGGGSDIFNISSTADIFSLIGYFLPAIIGVILLVKAKKKTNQ